MKTKFPEVPRKHEMIIRENQPLELPPDVVRGLLDLARVIRIFCLNIILHNKILLLCCSKPDC